MKWKNKEMEKKNKEMQYIREMFLEDDSWEASSQMDL